MRLLREYLTSQARRLVDVSRRATLAPTLLRVVLWLLGVIALLLAYPAQITGDPLVLPVVGVLALLPAASPRTRMVSVVLSLAAAGWLIATTVYLEPITVGRLIGLATVLYLLHTGAALAAVLPYDTVVAPEALVAWLLRALAVVAVGGALGVIALAGAGMFGGRTYLVATIAGLVTVGVLVRLLVRR
jgi:hypothetical protein